MRPDSKSPTRARATTRIQQVAIVTDSATALPDSMASDRGLFVAQMEVTIDDQTFLDGPDGEIKDFYSRLRKARKLPTTSAPRPETWLAAFKSASSAADSIFCITISGNMSAAFDAARVAVELARTELRGTEIRVFDSRSAAGSQALMVLDAGRRAAAGESLEEIERACADLSGRLRLIAMLDTLEYIHRGGRVPKFAVWATSLLNIKPVMEFSAGKVGAIARPRSRARAFRRLLSEVTGDLAGRKAHVNVMHADAAEDAAALMRHLSEIVDCREIFLTQFHPFMGAHTGPGLVAVSYWAE